MARKKKIDSNEPNKVVKKKKVGRPKKRGRKKSYYVPKKKSKKGAKKGFSNNLTYNRVRSVLWLNFKDDFPSYRAFISNQVDEQGNKIKGTSIVSQVFTQCKSVDCLDYWELETEDWWTGFDDRVWVVAPMLIQDPDNFLGILGSDRYVDANGQLLNRRFDGRQGDYIINGKAVRFKEFINHCNQMQSQGLTDASGVVPNFRFTGESEEIDDTEVYWNPFTKRWEVKIVICEPNGDINDYDFDPKEPDAGFDDVLIQDILNRTNTQEIPEEIIPTEEPRAGLSKDEIEIKKKELEQEDRRLKLEEDRSERINKLLQKYLDDKIDSETFERLLKLI